MSATPDSKRIGGTTLGQLDGLELLAHDLLCLEPIAGLALERRGIAYPLPERLIVVQVPLDGLAQRRVDDVLGVDDGQGRHEARQKQQRYALVHTDHLPDGSRTADFSGGPPRRQKTSGSMVSW